MYAEKKIHEIIPGMHYWVTIKGEDARLVGRAVMTDLVGQLPEEELYIEVLGGKVDMHPVDNVVEAFEIPLP